jgi:pimeloyl-ACP methyl ester carboxylesterase
MTIQAHQRHIEVPHGEDGTVKLAYLSWGADDAQHKAICIHGISRNSHDFAWLAPVLAEAGWHVVAVDMVGRGKSQWLDDAAGYTMPHYLQHLAYLVSELNLGEVDWIGTSMGGLIGMVAAARGAIPIRRLVLNDVGPFIAASQVGEIITNVGVDPVFADEDELQSYLMERYAPYGPVTDDQWRHLAHNSGRRDGAGRLRLHYDPDIVAPMRAAPAADLDLWELYDGIKAPTLLLRAGVSQVLDQETAEAMAERGPEASLFTFHGITHPLWLADDEQVHLIRDWLLGHPRTEDALDES